MEQKNNRGNKINFKLIRLQKIVFNERKAEYSTKSTV